MQRCTPSAASSPDSPDVPSAQPSQTPSLRMRQRERQLVAVLPRDARHLEVVMRLLVANPNIPVDGPFMHEVTKDTKNTKQWSVQSTS